MTLRTALRTSSNRAAVRLLEEVGIPQTVRYAKRLGVGLVPSVPSLALGSGEVTLEGMTPPTPRLPALACYRTPVLIRRVEDREGQVIYEAPSNDLQAVSEATAFLMSSMLSRRRQLRHGVEGARASGSRCLRPARPARPTTTSTRGSSATRPNWWPGCGLASTSPRRSSAGGYAGEIAVPLWGRFMKAATRGDGPNGFRRPKV